MRYVAFLRGINVGGRNIRMSELRACFEALGLQDVATILQTGNVVFSSDESATELKPMIEVGLTKNFGYPAKIQVYELQRLRQIIEASPFGSNDPQRHSYVIFFEDGLEQSLASEAAGLDGQVESARAGDGVLYWQVKKGQTLTSVLAKYLTYARYKNFNTNRNLNTLRKIVS